MVYLCVKYWVLAIKGTSVFVFGAKQVVKLAKFKKNQSFGDLTLTLTLKVKDDLSKVVALVELYNMVYTLFKSVNSFRRYST